MLTRSSQLRKAPGPPSLQFFLDLPKFRRDPLGGFFQATLSYGDVVRYRGVWVSHQLSHPDHIQHVLQGNFANYRKGRGYKILKLSLGEGLLTSEGALWQRQRKMTQPSFQGQQVASFVGTMAENTLAMLRRWEGNAQQNAAFDVVPDFMRLTLNIAAQVLFTTNLEADAESIRRTLDIGRDYSVDRAWSIFPPPLSIPTRRNREYRSALANIHGIIDRIIAGRRREPGRISDLLTMLMEARDESGAAMSDKQLRDEVITLLTAGHETTTLALAWTCFLIGTRPEVVERMTTEAAFLNGRTPAYEDLMKLRYSRMVVEESMRLYPPVWTLARTAVNEDEIGGYPIPAGSEILIFPYITQRHPKWWQDPDVFRPERFAPENSAARPRYAYLPFGAGPRTCIGLNFAMTEILVALTLILQRFQIKLAIDPATVRADPSVTLQPRPGVPVRLERARVTC
ncbi:MAG TPA: cytochrome P450 [Candidatus Angelobacter sp.]|nr:cytochrome P450 [Candidatus Angelobacter sp.]